MLSKSLKGWRTSLQINNTSSAHQIAKESPRKIISISGKYFLPTPNLEVALEGEVDVEDDLPLLHDVVDLPPGGAEALRHGAVYLGPGLLGENHLVCLSEQLLHWALLGLEGGHHLHLNRAQPVADIINTFLAKEFPVSPDSDLEGKPQFDL